MLNETHDPDARSWLAAANDRATDFPIQNLPYGSFRRRGASDALRVGVAIGDQILDLQACHRLWLFGGDADTAAQACRQSNLNALMGLGRPYWSALRHRLHELLSAAHADAARHRQLIEPTLVPQADAEMAVPAAIGDYTDFYASVFHATNVGRMMRPDNPLLPNYKHVPIGYHGRASSIVISGTPVVRPSGQTKPDGLDAPVFGPSRRLDYELEVGVFVGPGNALGQPIPHDDIDDQLFGLCLVNDWSARDIQQWEYQPLGPFLAKSFATTVSPWIVPMEALEPFLVPPFVRPDGDPAPLAYLDGRTYRERGGLDLGLEVFLSSAKMWELGIDPVRVSRGNLRDMYWTLGQMATHHASNGCNLRPGDLLASGTVSGPGKDARGCLLELAWRGSEPLELPTGETRAFLEDGDEVIFRGSCARDGAVRIGFGECRGRVLPARQAGHA